MYDPGMRTTVNLEDDVAQAVARMQRERGIGLSAAVNELVRAGLTTARADYHYRPVSYDMGVRVDISNIADVLELLDEESGSGSAHAS